MATSATSFSEPWLIYSLQYIVGFRQQMVCGRQQKVCGRQQMVCGRQQMVCGIKLVVDDRFYVVYGMWQVVLVCILQMVCSAWQVCPVPVPVPDPMSLEQCARGGYGLWILGPEKLRQYLHQEALWTTARRNTAKFCLILDQQMYQFSVGVDLETVSLDLKLSFALCINKACTKLGKMFMQSKIVTACEMITVSLMISFKIGR